jgi:DNA-binding XRE family transcriptional regulator
LAKIHENIIIIRKQLGFTQKVMADKLGIAESTYNRIENNEIDLAYERHLLPIAQIFQMTVEDLFVYKSNKYTQVEELQKLKQILKNLLNE